jgi:FkbM family methyltransferase
MPIQELITKISKLLPSSLKIALRGNSASPNRLANFVHVLLNRLPGDRYPILVCTGPLEGYRMRVDWQIHRSLVYGTWEPEVVEAIRGRVTPGMTALDVGAQSGFYSLLFSKLVGPAGNVVAFEPLPANYRLLAENLDLNRTMNVTAECSAVTDRSGEIKFDFPAEAPWLLAGPVLASDNRGTFNVPSVSVDDYLLERKSPVDFIKIDIEGAETMALRGAIHTLRRYHPILVIELHSTGADLPLVSVPAYLEELGYQVQWLRKEGDTAHILATWRGE